MSEHILNFSLTNWCIWGRINLTEVEHIYYLVKLSIVCECQRHYSRLRIDVGQGINVGPGNFGQNNNHKALNKCRAWNKMCKLVLK